MTVPQRSLISVPEELLRDLGDLAARYINETGGCEHNANICVCVEIALLAQVENCFRQKLDEASPPA